MANCCFYELRAVGDENNVKEFLDAMKCTGKYADSGVGRVYTCYLDCEDSREDGSYFMDLSGDCAWSVLTAMRNNTNPNNLEKISERLSLNIEVFSSECGYNFMEHFNVCCGDILTDDCVDYYEICMDDGWESLSEEKMNLLMKNGITKENCNNHIVDGYIHIGGMEIAFEI